MTSSSIGMTTAHINTKTVFRPDQPGSSSGIGGGALSGSDGDTDIGDGQEIRGDPASVIAARGPVFFNASVYSQPTKNRYYLSRMLVLDNVKKSHSRGETIAWALRGVSGRIEAGSFTFIVGPSGSGKSTLLYLMGALEEPTAGSIAFNGRRLATFSRNERDAYRQRDVGFVFQNFNLLQNMNAVDNVLVPFLPGGISTELRNRAVELLKMVGLGERLSHRPNQLSGGEQQRVAIARALLKQPKLILADEPTGELDTETGSEVFGYLRKLHAENETTVVVVTHDQRYLQASDDVWRLRDGLLEESGTLEKM